MRLKMIAIASLIVLVGCESEQERMTKVREKQIQSTIQMDWHRGVPFDGLADASKLCKEHHDLAGCNVVQSQVLDIAIAYESCRKDQRSQLCQAVVQKVGKHRIATILPRSNAIQLPSSHFYWELPTTLLESQADNFGYRSEAAGWWWQSWARPILSCLALLIVGFSGWYWRNEESKAKQERAKQENIRRSQQEKLRIAAKHQAQQARIEAEHIEKLEREETAAEQKRLAEKQAEELRAAEAAKKLADERAAVAALLQAACSTGSERKGRNALSESCRSR